MKDTKEIKEDNVLKVHFNKLQTKLLNSTKETTFNKQELDLLWVALRYYQINVTENVKI